MSRLQDVVEVARASMEELSVPGVALGVLFEGEEEAEGLFKGDRAVFLRGPEGRIAWLRLGGRVYSPAE